MPLKATPITATASRLADVQDTSIAGVITTSNYSDGAWIREIMQQLTVNQNALKVKLKVYNH